MNAVAEQYANDQTREGQIPDEQLEEYMATAVELVAAAKHVEENSVSDLVSEDARVRFCYAIQNLELSRTAFETTVRNKLINIQDATAFMNAVITFLDARTEFFRTTTAALEEKTNKVGASIH